MAKKLRFTLGGNAKLPVDTAIFSVPSGWTCPGASKCLAKVDKDPKSRKLTEGPKSEFRCFSASMEAAFGTVHNLVWNNLGLLGEARGKDAKARLLMQHIPEKKNWYAMRIHVHGDFFNQDYFDAWLEVARSFPDRTFYFYTKSIPYWVERFELIGDGHTPGELDNVVPTMSAGGDFDDLGYSLGLRTATVIMHPEDADGLNLEIDKDDSHARNYGPDFLQVIHGQQRPGSPGSKAQKRMKDEKIRYNYSKA